MAGSLGTASLLVKLDMTSFKASLDRMKADATRSFRSLADVARQTGQSIKRSFEEAVGPSNQLRNMMAGATAAVVGFATASIKMASDMEQTTIAFETMLGSAEAADKLLRQMEQFAATTPFEFVGLTEATKRLLAFGFTAEEVIPNLKMLGDVAAGLSIPVDDLAYVFGQTKTAGALLSDSLRTLLKRGVPVLDVLAERLNTTKQGVRDMVAAGKVSFEDLQGVFVDLTSEGGRFFDLMEKQSHSLGGLMSNLKDNVELAMISLGQELVEAFDLKKRLAGVIEWVERLRDVITDRGILNVLGEYKDTIYGIAAAIMGALVPSFLNTAIALGRSGAKLAPWAAAGYLVYKVVTDLGVRMEDVLPIVARFGAVIGGIVDVAAGAATSISALVRAVIQSIGDWGRYFGMIMPQIHSIQAYLQAGMLGAASDAIKALPQVMANASRVAFRGLSDTVLDDFEKANAQIGSGWDKIWGGVTGNMSAATTNLVDTLGDSLKDGVETATGFVNGLATGLGDLTDGFLDVDGAATIASGIDGGIKAYTDLLRDASDATEAFAKRTSLRVRFGEIGGLEGIVEFQQQLAALDWQIQALVDKGLTNLGPEDWQRLLNLLSRRDTVQGAMDDLRANLGDGIKSAIKGAVADVAAWLKTQNPQKDLLAPLANIRAEVLPQPLASTRLLMHQQNPTDAGMPDMAGMNATGVAFTNLEARARIYFDRLRIGLDTQLAMAGGLASFVAGLRDQAVEWVANSDAMKSVVDVGGRVVGLFRDLFHPTDKAAENANKVLTDTQAELERLAAVGRLLGPSFDVAGQSAQVVRTAIADLAGTVPDSNDSLKTLLALLADLTLQGELAARALPGVADVQGLKTLLDVYRNNPALLTGKDWDKLFASGAGMGRPGGVTNAAADRAAEVRKNVEAQLQKLSQTGVLLGDSFDVTGQSLRTVEAAIADLAGTVPETNADLQALLVLLQQLREATKQPIGRDHLRGLQESARAFMTQGGDVPQEMAQSLMDAGVLTGFPDGVKQWASMMETATDDIGEQMVGLLASAAAQFGADLGKAIGSGDSGGLGQSLVGGLTGLGSSLVGLLVPGVTGIVAQFGVSLLGGLFGGLLDSGSSQGRELSETGNTLARSSNTPAIEYNAIAEITLASGFTLDDPRTMATIRETARSVSLDLLKNLELI